MKPIHAGYEKIAESLAELELDEAGLRALRKTEWVVTEKIHGANFALVADLSGLAISLRAAKRKAFLDPSEDFFGHRALLDRIGPSLREAFARVRAAHPEATGATLYGELFGGTYPHPEVPPCPGVEPVQTGIFYSPRIEFSAFDIAVELPGPDPRAGRGGRVYLDYDRALAVFAAARLFCAEPLFVGSYEDAMSWPLGADSTVPARLGLPPLGRPNPAEGVVVKPMKSLVVATRGGPMRPVLKRKIPQFAEDRRFHEASKWAPPPRGAEPLARLEWEMLALVTDNRLQAAISKVGNLARVDEPRAREVLALFIDEVWTALAAGQGAALASVTAEDLALLRSVLEDEAQRLLATHLAPA
jgi:Rnl2 family RNA ligase